MNKTKNLYCSCGTVIGQEVFSHIDPRMRGFGQEVFSHIDPRMRGFGQNSDRVYKFVYNGKEARTKDGMLVPLRGNQYMCKNCYKGN